MIQANRVHSTPPTNTPIDTTRRGFLGGTVAALAAGTAVNVAALATMRPAAATIAIAAPAGLPDTAKAGQALKDAVRALMDSHDALESAKARFAEDDAKVTRWAEEHPEPRGKRPRLRWSRRWCKYRDEVCMDSWHAQIEAESHFRKAQGAVAKIQPADRHELALMAATAAIYDKTYCGDGFGQSGIISYGVVLGYFRLSQAGEVA